MAQDADVNIGFPGSVNSAQWAVIAGSFSARYAVSGAGALKVSAGGGTGDRSLTVAAGGAWGDGVFSEFNSSTHLRCAASSGTRWDTVVVRRDWTEGLEGAQLVVLQGGSSKAIAAGRTVDPGATVADQPIALVRCIAGSSVVQEVVDLRCWAGHGGGLVGPNEDVLKYLDDVGTVVHIGSRTWVRSIVSGSPGWVEVQPIVASGGITAIRKVSQSWYDSNSHDASTLYVIV